MVEAGAPWMATRGDRRGGSWRSVDGDLRRVSGKLAFRGRRLAQGVRRRGAYSLLKDFFFSDRRGFRKEVAGFKVRGLDRVIFNVRDKFISLIFS
jgi:hypothetical protein